MATSREVRNTRLINCLLCCQHVDVDKVTLSCQHVFCHSCLTEYYRHLRLCANPAELPTKLHSLDVLPSVECPICVKDSTVSRTDVINHPVIHLADGLEIKESRGSRSEKCEVCPEKSRQTARKKCRTCAKLLCERCFAKHDRRHAILRHHTTKYELKCKKHRKHVAHFCKNPDCQRLICDRCVMDVRGHDRHPILTFDQLHSDRTRIADRTRQNQQIEKLMQDKLHQKTTMEHQLRNLDRDCDHTIIDIKRHANVLKEKIDEECSRMIAQLRSFQSDLHKLHSNHSAYLDYTQLHLSTLKFYIQEVSERGKEPTFLLHEDDLAECINKLTTSPKIQEREQRAHKSFNKRLKFNSSVEFTAQRVKIGEIHEALVEPTVLPITTDPSPMSIPLPRGHLLYQTSPTADSTHSPSGGICFARAQRLALTEYKDHRIAFYDLENKTRISGGIKKEHFLPQKLAVLNDRLFVTDDRLKCIRSFDHLGKEEFVTKKNTFSSPSGIAMTTDGKHLVVSDILDHKISIVNIADQSVTKRFEHGLKVPEFVAVNNQNQIIVSDKENHRICIFDLHGRHIRTFGKYGTGDGQLDSPTGVCVDEYGNILVADSNNLRVCRFTDTGRYIDTVLKFTPGAAKPHGLALSSQGDLALTDMSTSTLQVYRVYNYSQ